MIATETVAAGLAAAALAVCLGTEACPELVECVANVCEAFAG